MKETGLSNLSGKTTVITDPDVMSSGSNKNRKENSGSNDFEQQALLPNSLIKGCRKRKRISQKKLYEMYYAYGMSISLCYSDSREEAALILNDAFLKVFDNIRKYDSDRPFKPWFRRILINTAINHYHQTKKINAVENSEINENQHFDEERITSEIGYREIIELVRELPPSYRAVFNLFVIEGFSHAEIARSLNISIGTSKSNLAKAKKSLRLNLGKILNR